MVTLSVILPVFNEQDSIESSIIHLAGVLDTLKTDYEIIFVDDGSSDDTWRFIQKESKKNKKIKGVSLSRNFGKERALYAGLQKASGDAVITMDGDLQHPPSVIPDLFNKWQETGCDVVNGVKVGRENEDFVSSWLVKKFYTVYKFFTGIIIQNASDFKLLSRRMVDKYVELNERDLFYRGLVPWMGFHQESVEFKVEKREVGTSKWSVVGRCFLAINAITSFSALPLQIVTVVGFLFLAMSSMLVMQTFYMWFSGQALEGFTTLILILLLMGSILMISLGVIGQYLAKIYSEVKRRPIYILKETAGFGNKTKK